jgi:hypothetical protein
MRFLTPFGMTVHLHHHPVAIKEKKTLCASVPLWFNPRPTIATNHQSPITNHQPPNSRNDRTTCTFGGNDVSPSAPA